MEQSYQIQTVMSIAKLKNKRFLSVSAAGRTPLSGLSLIAIF
jgi:hypothetical protein